MATTTRKTPQKSKADLRTRAEEAKRERDAAAAAKKREDALAYIAKRRIRVAEYLKFNLEIPLEECDLVFIRPQTVTQQPDDTMAVIRYDGLLLSVQADGFFHLERQSKDRPLIQWERRASSIAFRDLAGLGAVLDARSKEIP